MKEVQYVSRQMSSVSCKHIVHRVLLESLLVLRWLPTITTNVSDRGYGWYTQCAFDSSGCSQVEPLVEIVHRPLELMMFNDVPSSFLLLLGRHLLLVAMHLFLVASWFQMVSCLETYKSWVSSLLGRRPSLVRWRPSLVGWRPTLLGWRPFECFISSASYFSLSLEVPRMILDRNKWYTEVVWQLTPRGWTCLGIGLYSFTPRSESTPTPMCKRFMYFSCS